MNNKFDIEAAFAFVVDGVAFSFITSNSAIKIDTNRPHGMETANSTKLNHMHI